MAKIKTSELSGPALDWAVAQAMGLIIVYTNPVVVQRDIRNEMRFNPSTDREIGGHIIEREKIGVSCHFIDRHQAWVWYAKMGQIYRSAPSLLVAAMRCYVASKLGDEVDVPQELLP